MKRNIINNNIKISKRIKKIQEIKYIIVTNIDCFLPNAIILQFANLENIQQLMQKHNYPRLVLFGMEAQKYYTQYKMYDIIMTDNLLNL